MKRSGMVAVSFRGVNEGFCSHFRAVINFNSPVALTFTAVAN